jgi:hypothetical protein
MTDAKPASLLQLRQGRISKLIRSISLSRQSIRIARGDLARIAREWHTNTQRINRTLKSYSALVEGLDIYPPEPIGARDLVDCLKGCQQDEQKSKLDEMELELVQQSKLIKAAGKKRPAARARLAKKRERREAKETARRAKRRAKRAG